MPSRAPDILNRNNILNLVLNNRNIKYIIMLRTNRRSKWLRKYVFYNLIGGRHLGDLITSGEMAYPVKWLSSHYAFDICVASVFDAAIGRRSGHNLTRKQSSAPCEEFDFWIDWNASLNCIRSTSISSILF